MLSLEQCRNLKRWGMPQAKFSEDGVCIDFGRGWFRVHGEPGEIEDVLAPYMEMDTELCPEHIEAHHPDTDTLVEFAERVGEKVLGPDGVSISTTTCAGLSCAWAVYPCGGRAIDPNDVRVIEGPDDVKSLPLALYGLIAKMMEEKDEKQN